MSEGSKKKKGGMAEQNSIDDDSLFKVCNLYKLINI